MFVCINFEHKDDIFLEDDFSIQYNEKVVDKGQSVLCPIWISHNNPKVGISRGVVANVEDCDIEESSNSSWVIVFTWRLEIIGNVWTPPTMGLKLYHYCSSTRVVWYYISLER